MPKNLNTIHKEKRETESGVGERTRRGESARMRHRERKVKFRD